MKRSLVFLLLIFTLLQANAQKTGVDKKVDSVLALMTLDEKIGQMNQYNGDWEATGPITPDGDKQNQIRKGMLGSMINVTGVAKTRSLQELAMQSRLKIPLLFGQDVIHGYRTIFPIPLAEAASWDLEAIQRSARIAAIESSAAGVHWTFAPMVDISRDPRWGRVMEGAGEDPYLGSMIAVARVKGFQGNKLGDLEAVMASAKHFAAYGAAVGGRDYNSVDMSLRQLHEVYLPPFKAAAEAGVATFMNSFNDLNGIPASASKLLQRDILKRDWKFKGFVVSDWGSIGEMINHGYSKNNSEAAMQAVNAGSDMDMESRSYIQNLGALVKSGKVKLEVINDAVRRILRKKFELGLFDDPYRFNNEEREKAQWNNTANLEAAKDMARKSIVLLKNENEVLPLPTQKAKIIAVIGPLVKDKSSNLGFWSYDWPDDSLRISSLWDGIILKGRNELKFTYAKGCNVNDSIRSGFDEAIAVANNADLIILSLGEARDYTGEAKSKSNLHLPGVQNELFASLKKTGKPIVTLIHAGRPLVLDKVADQSDALLYTWWLGTKAGDAIADLLFGDYNPSGKLPMSFPLTEGQIPIYYNHYNTGRPAKNDEDRFYRSGYIDLSLYPKYPFGFGIGYSLFEYANLRLDRKTLKPGQIITASVDVKNTGKYAGKETVQLYIQDLFASVVRPVKELKGFQQIILQPGETKTVQFKLSTNDLRFYNEQLAYIFEPGEFKIYVGGNSRDVKETGFELVK